MTDFAFGAGLVAWAVNAGVSMAPSEPSAPTRRNERRLAKVNTLGRVSSRIEIISAGRIRQARRDVFTHCEENIIN